MLEACFVKKKKKLSQSSPGGEGVKALFEIHVRPRLTVRAVFLRKIEMEINSHIKTSQEQSE